MQVGVDDDDVSMSTDLGGQQREDCRLLLGSVLRNETE